MSSTEYKADIRDILFQVNDVLRLGELTKLEHFKEFDQDLFQDVIRESTSFAEEVLAPTNQIGDQEGLTIVDGKAITPDAFKKAYQKQVEAGWIGLDANPEYGGQGLPVSVSVAASEAIAAANISLSLYPILAVSAARLIESFGTDEQKKIYLENMYTGKWGGTMCLTEPDAGSYVGDAKTSAKPDGKHYKISGSKQFITSGSHDLNENIIHMVLARVPDAPAGTKGISLFIVPNYRLENGKLVDNDVHLVSLENKMGIKASSTCVLSFGDNGNCHGYLLQEPNKGMSQMFQMMNEARLGVGIQSVAQAGAALGNTWSYAKDRIQGTDIAAGKDAKAPRVAIVEHPDVRDKLMYMKALTEGIRGIVYATAYYIDMAHHGPNEKKEYYQDLADIHTPIIKAYGSDEALNVVSNGIQILGGVGYTKDYPLEQNYRDLRIAPIYEGTNAIQSLDLIGRKLVINKGRLLKTLLEEFSQLKGIEPESEILENVISTWAQYRKILIAVCSDLQKNFMMQGAKKTVLHSCKILNLFGDVITGYHLIQQGLATEKKLQEMEVKLKRVRKKAENNPEIAFLYNKLLTVRYFIENVMPRQDGYAKIIQQGDFSALDAML